MPHTGLETLITSAFEDRANITPATQGDIRHAVESALRLLDAGKLRVAEKIEGEQGPASWRVNQWLKKAVLLSFRLNDMSVIDGGPGGATWYDKVPSKFAHWTQKEHASAGFRSVPGAIVRHSAFIAPGAILMPSFVNLGAYVDAGTMVDTWVTVGSCAQIGKNVPIAITEPSPTMTPSATSARAPMKHLSSTIVGLACRGSSTPPMPTPPDRCTLLPICAQDPTVAQVSIIVPVSTKAPRLTKEGMSTTPGAI